ncbi:hypothetical protein KRX19_02505 [Cardiobacteriaceae bacterium TAE3-ERU3]|nr:hypothetical protein [Cardiobacteriaceae bacterium TAE3-ERU3]
MDICFDRGYISFDDEGRMLISTALSEADKHALGLHHGMGLTRIEASHIKFLIHHREFVYKK